MNSKFYVFFDEIYTYYKKILQKKLNEEEILELLSVLMIISAFITFIGLQFLNLLPPYGRYLSKSYFYNYTIPARVSWFFQEIPSVIFPVFVLWKFKNVVPLTNFTVLCFFLVHYLHRTFIYCLLIQGGKPIPINLFLLGLIFTSWNGYIQSFYHAKYVTYTSKYMYSFRVILGAFLFLYGMIVNIHSDTILRNLRKSGEIGYKIPYGGLFKYISCANFHGEIVEWLGYSLIAKTWTAWAFFFFTVGNVLPRALEHHNWYLKKFDNYPKERKAIIPWIL